MVGIINNELFMVEGPYNHAAAKNACSAFGASQPSRADIARVATEAEYGYCGK